jgi:hypothetical protein
MLIITGTGRCGTGMFSKLFGGYHEYEAPFLVKNYFEPVSPFCDPFDRFNTRVEIMKKAHQEIDPRRFINSSNLYIHFTDALFYLYGDVKFIFVVRNGKDFARSAVSRNWHNYRTFGIVPPDDSAYYSQWAEMSPLQRAAWIWTYRNSIALKRLSSVPDKYKKIVRLEDCCHDSVLDELERFTDIKITAHKWAKNHRYNTNGSFSMLPVSRWSETMHREFNLIAGTMMQFFGYE